MRLLGGTLLVWALAGCSDSLEDNLVGNTCTQNTQCRVMCETGVEFPDGFCTLSCSSDTQCPHGTVCMTTAGGVCLFPCRGIVDCQFLGAGWRCQKKDHLPNGQAMVCIGN